MSQFLQTYTIYAVQLIEIVDFYGNGGNLC